MSLALQDFDGQVFSEANIKQYENLLKETNLETLSQEQKGLIQKAFNRMTVDEILGEKGGNFLTKFVVKHMRTIYFNHHQKASTQKVLGAIKDHAEKRFQMMKSSLKITEDLSPEEQFQLFVTESVDRKAQQKNYLVSADDLEKFKNQAIEEFASSHLRGDEFDATVQNFINHVQNSKVKTQNANELISHVKDFLKIRHELQGSWPNDKEAVNETMKELTALLEKEDGTLVYDKEKIENKKNELIKTKTKAEEQKKFEETLISITDGMKEVFGSERLDEIRDAIRNEAQGKTLSPSEIVKFCTKQLDEFQKEKEEPFKKEWTEYATKLEICENRLKNLGLLDRIHYNTQGDTSLLLNLKPSEKELTLLSKENSTLGSLSNKISSTKKSILILLEKKGITGSRLKTSLGDITEEMEKQKSEVENLRKSIREAKKGIGKQALEMDKKEVVEEVSEVDKTEKDSLEGSDTEEDVSISSTLPKTTDLLLLGTIQAKTEEKEGVDITKFEQAQDLKNNPMASSKAFFTAILKKGDFYNKILLPGLKTQALLLTSDKKSAKQLSDKWIKNIDNLAKLWKESGSAEQENDDLTPPPSLTVFHGFDGTRIALSVFAQSGIEMKDMLKYIADFEIPQDGKLGINFSAFNESDNLDRLDQYLKDPDNTDLSVFFEENSPVLKASKPAQFAIALLAIRFKRGISNSESDVKTRNSANKGIKDTLATLDNALFKILLGFTNDSFVDLGLFTSNTTIIPNLVPSSEEDSLKVQKETLTTENKKLKDSNKLLEDKKEIEKNEEKIKENQKSLQKIEKASTFAKNNKRKQFDNAYRDFVKDIATDTINSVYYLSFDVQYQKDKKRDFHVSDLVSIVPSLTTQLKASNKYFDSLNTLDTAKEMRDTIEEEKKGALEQKIIETEIETKKLKQECEETLDKFMCQLISTSKKLLPIFQKNPNYQSVLGTIDNSILKNLKENPLGSLEEESYLNWMVNNIGTPTTQLFA